MIKSIAAALWVVSVSIAALTLLAFIASLVMCFMAGWGPQGPMDPGWGIVVMITGATCLITGTIGLLLRGLARRKEN
jgi:hypothetical protein